MSEYFDPIKLMVCAQPNVPTPAGEYHWQRLKQVYVEPLYFAFHENKNITSVVLAVHPKTYQQPFSDKFLQAANIDPKEHGVVGFRIRLDHNIRDITKARDMIYDIVEHALGTKDHGLFFGEVNVSRMHNRLEKEKNPFTPKY